MSPPDIVLIHGGLHEPMNAHRFWEATGVVAAFHRIGLTVHTPDRLPSPPSWEEDAAHVAETLNDYGADRRFVLVAGSNGCSTAVRLAVDHPQLVGAFSLCWPVTPAPVDQRLVEHLSRAATPAIARTLLTGDSLRGVTDEEFKSLALPTAVMASDPANQIHQRPTAERLLGILLHGDELPAMPEPVAPGFDSDRFVDIVARWINAIR